jgi:hypothetical protein
MSEGISSQQQLTVVSVGTKLFMRRRRFKQTQPLEERPFAEAKRLRDEARSFPPGAVRDRLLRKARQAEAGSHMSKWLTSPLHPSK